MRSDIVDVEPAGDYRLVLTYEGGERREVNIADVVPFDGVFASLKEQAYFRQVRVHDEIGTIVWPNGADLCPDVLYEQSRPIAPLTPARGTDP